MKKYASTILVIVLFLTTGLTAGCVTSKVYSKAGTTTTVILIRHADRNDHGKLTPKGKKRAEALVNAVAPMNISAIYSPDLERNLDTVRPLARHLGIKITLTSRVSIFAVDAIAEEILNKYSGKTVLWVGNVTGNLQALYRRLGGKGRGPLEYGQISVLTISDQGEVLEKQQRFDP